MLHRDDLDFRVVEKMESDLSEAMPGHKLVFAGDLPEGSCPELEDAFREMRELAEASFENGTCLSCLAKMPDYEIEKEDWEPADGWQLLISAADHQHCWVCPECEDIDGDHSEDFLDEDFGELEGDFE